MLTKQQRIPELAKRTLPLGFTSLNHYLDLNWLSEAYRGLRKDIASVRMAIRYAPMVKELDSNLPLLLEQAKSGQ